MATVSRNQNRPRTKAEQRERTKRALIDKARSAFSEDGYERVKVAEVAKAAGVTTGPVYHHFGAKRELFLAVLEQIHEEVASLIAEALTGLEPWDELVVGSKTFLEASTDPSRQRIMLVDGPAVLGWETWRKLDAQTSMRLLEDVIADLIDRDELPSQPVQPLVHLLSGAMNEAALWLASSRDRERDLAEMNVALERLLESLRAP
jgi:AcrR family transcriptional regulator